MSSTIIGYKNLAEDSIISVINTNSNISTDNLKTWTFHDPWYDENVSGDVEIIYDLGTQTDVDYLAIFGHTLGSMGATIQFDGRNSAADPWTNIISNQTITNNNCIFKKFDIQNYRYYKFTIGASDTIFLSVVALGECLSIPRRASPGFKPPISDNYNILNSETNKSLFIGRSISKAAQNMRLSLQLLSASFIRSDYKSFIDHYNEYPFFLVWNIDDYPDESVIAWTQRRTDFPEYSDTLNMKVRLSLNVLRNID